MMNEQSILRYHGEAGRWRTSLLGLAVLVVALIAALLVSTATAGSQDDPPVDDPPFFVELGRLELVANDTDGDLFRFTDGGGTEIEEGLSRNNKSRLLEDGPADLVTLTPTGKGSGNQLYVGLKDHRIGVRGQGEGNGIPAVQINKFGVPASDQTLTIELNGSDLGDGAATEGRIGLKMKFGATATLQPLFKDVAAGPATPVVCDGGSSSDCGPDSNGDLKAGIVGDGTYLFDAVEISIDLPDDGAVSLVSTGAQTTWFDIVDARSADASIEKSVVESGPFDIGDTVTYQLDVTNNSDVGTAATDVVVVDELPTGLDFVAASDGGTHDATDNDVTWTIASIAAGATETLTVTTTVTADAPGGIVLSNTATLTPGPEPGDDPTNNSSSADITVNVDYDLSVAKVVLDDDEFEPSEGDPVTYQVTVTYESGNAAADDVEVEDVLPDGVTLSGVPSADDGAYDAGTGIWSGIDLDGVGDSASLTIPVTVDADTAGTTITNTATVTDTRDDENNSASADITPVDGILSCTAGSDTASQSEGGLSSDFQRLSVDLDVDLSLYPILESNKAGNVEEHCVTKIPYTQDIDGEVIGFAPDSPDLVGLYRGELSFPAGEGDEIVLALESDNGIVGGAFSDLRGCPYGEVDGPGEPSAYADADSQLARFFPEMGAYGNYPQLPDSDVGTPGDRNVSCVVSYETVAGGMETWVLLVVFDPRYR